MRELSPWVAAEIRRQCSLLHAIPSFIIVPRIASSDRILSKTGRTVRQMHAELERNELDSVQFLSTPQLRAQKFANTQ